MGRQGRRTLATLGSALALLLPAGVAQAAPTWLQPVPLSSPPGPQNFFALGAGTPDVAFDGGGNAVAAWQRRSDVGPPVVQVTFRPAGGSFAPATDIGPTVESTLGLTDGPQVEVDAAGNAFLAFVSDTGRVMRAERAPGGGFSTPVEISTGTGNHDVDMDMSPSGHVILAWLDGSDDVQLTTRAPGGGFSAPSNLGTDVNPSLSSTPSVAINDQGAAVIAWVGLVGADDRVRARVRPAGGSFGPVQELSAALQDAEAPDVAIDPQGRATAVWQRLDGANEIVESKQANDAGTFPGGTDTVSNAGVNGTLPQVVVDGENTAVAVWNSGSTVTGASRQSNASFGDPQPISAPDSNTSLPPRLAVDQGGNVLAIWSPITTGGSIQAARRPKGGAFGGVDLLPRAGFDLVVGPAIAFDDQGNALALWTSGNANQTWTVFATAYDVAPPTLAALSVPGTGVAGQPVGMAAAATDRWSPVAISWSFGDGASGAGDAVSHAFGTAGAFTVTATATDGVGNASSATRSILISPAAPPPEKRITSKVRVTWGVSGRKIFLLRLSTGKVPKGAKLQLRCKGKKCPFKKRGSKKRRGGRITLFKEVKAAKAARKKRRSFRAKQRLQVRITARDHIGKVVRYKLRKGKIPSGKTRCLPIGSSKPRKRCP